MANLFDSVQKAAFGIVSNTMGYDATWQPSDGSDEQTARVLLKEPTKEYELGGVEYSPTLVIVEYHQPSLAGLKTAVDNGEQETVTVDGKDYYVRQVTAIFDGKTYRAVCQLADPE